MIHANKIIQALDDTKLREFHAYQCARKYNQTRWGMFMESVAVELRKGAEREMDKRKMNWRVSKKQL